MSTPELALPEAVYEHIKAVRQDRKPDGWWHFSDSGYDHRKRVLARADKPKLETRPQSLLTFEYGHRVENIMREALLKKYDGVAHGKVELPQYHARGTFDLLLFIDDIEETWLLDVKSASAASYGFSTRQGNKQHRAQVTAYSLAVEENGYSVSKPGMVGEDNVDECIEKREPVKIDKCIVLYVDKEYGNLHADVFDKQEQQRIVTDDYTRLNAAWKAYEKDGTLPPEVPLEPAKPGGKHVKEHRVKVGEPCPAGLCSPLYCPYLPHCPTIANFWRRKANFDLTLPVEANKENNNAK